MFFWNFLANFEIISKNLSKKAHVFAVADAAFESMKHENVSIIVSGESGSGKSFSTQILIQHLMTLARIGNKQTRLTASQELDFHVFCFCLMSDSKRGRQFYAYQ